MPPTSATGLDELGSLLREHRTMKGWSQGQVAEKVGGLTQQQVSHYEQGENEPPAGMFARLVFLLDIPVQRAIDVAREIRLTFLYLLSDLHERGTSPPPPYGQSLAVTG